MLPPIHLTTWGSSGPRIVLVHGGAQGGSIAGARHFARQEALAGRGFHVLVPDRPGHGESPARGRPDDARLDGEWISELLGDGAHLVGHSFGGACALNAAARRPEAVKTLTLVEPAMLALATHSWAVRRLILRLVAARIFARSDAARMRAISEILHIPPELGAARDRAELQRMAAGLAALRPPTRRALASELEVIRRHHVPLLVVTGGWSAAFTAVGDAVAVSGAGEHVIVASPHHFPQLVSDEFNTLLAAAVDRAGAKEPA